jgi:curved DNA-binding protein CbpA
MSIILLIIAVILVLSVFPKLLGFILQLAIISIGFSFHPLIGIFLLIAYACDWLGLNKKKDAKQKEESNRTRTNFYEEQRKQEEYKRRQEQQRQEQYRKHQEQQRQKTYQQRTTSGFFTGCTTKEQLKKRHRELCKKYHPDKGGNPETFKKMQAEYEMLKIKYQ